MKKWVSNHPYFFVSAVFLIIIFIGWQFLFWEQDDFEFLLLLYFIVTLGIRMDDISRKIGRGLGKAYPESEDAETIIGHLDAISSSLVTLNATLAKLLKTTQNEEP